MITVIAAVDEEVSDLLSNHGFRLEETKSARLPYVRRSSSVAEVTVVVSGIGRAAAKEATRAAIETLRPRLLISTGFAGALDPTLATGDLLVFDEIVASGGTEDHPAAMWVSEAQLRADLLSSLHGSGRRAKAATCVSVPRLVVTAAAKKGLREQLNAHAADMESYWVANEAARAGIRSMAVRAVLDEADQDLPSLVGRVTATNRPRWLAAGLHLAVHPRETRTAFRLAGQAAIARKAISAAVLAVASIESAALAAVGESY